MAKKCVYTVEPGKYIYLNGKPYFSIRSEATVRDFSPHHIDVLTKHIAAFLNKKGCLVVKAYPEVNRWEKGSRKK